MTIAICASLDFMDAIFSTAEKLRGLGHTVVLPPSAEMVARGETTLGRILQEKETGEIAGRIAREDTFRVYYKKIQDVDAVLVLNLKKKGIEGYIGGNVFLEMGFAHVLNKKIFLLNEIPDMAYRDEIRGMQPIVLHGDLSGIS